LYSPLRGLSRRRLTPNFRQNFVLLGTDEAHVLVPWGKTFRKAYQQIPHLIRRLPDDTSVGSASATLSEKDELGLCSALGFNIKRGDVHRMRLSCERPNVRMIVMELTHGLHGYGFSDIAWAFRQGVKAVVYCTTLELCFRVAIYGWRQYPGGSQPLKNVRVWTSITSSSYNSCTLNLFENNADTSVIVATVAFGMGMNIQNIVHSTNLGLPTSLSGLHQQNVLGMTSQLRRMDGPSSSPALFLSSVTSWKQRNEVRQRLRTPNRRLRRQYS